MNVKIKKNLSVGDAVKVIQISCVSYIDVELSPDD